MSEEESEKMEIDNVSDKDKASYKTSDSEGESSDEMSENDEELEKQATDFEKKVEENPYEYNSYVELIKLLQKMAEIERLRKAREKMSRHFPLTPELWLSWLQDEISLAASDVERSAVVELFERAVQDYLSVDLWLEYAQFSIGNMGLQNGIQTVRNTFERALTAVGLHAAKGAILWEAYREFENVMLGMLQSKADDTNLSESQKQELAAQKKCLVAIFRRQMACPLLDMEKTYQEFTEWLNEEPSRRDEVDIKNIESGFKKALLKLSKILPYEEQLLSSDDASRADHYRTYLRYEMSGDDPARVQCLYERAVAELCLDASMWLEYIEYLDTTLKIDTVVLPVCKRAVWNCPWSSPLWQHYLKALERYKKPFDEVKDVMEQALSVGFSTAEDYRNLWLGYIDYMRRRVDWSTDPQLTQLAELRVAFNRACDHLAQYYGLQGDPNCEILRYWARIEAAYCKNMERFRLLWNDILSQGHDTTAAMWLEYIQWERAFGDSKHLKRLFPRALASTQDWPESIGTTWLNFERDEGTLDSYEFCMTKYKSRMKQINDQRERRAAKEAEVTEKGEKWKHQKQDRGKKQNPKDAWRKKHETEGKWAAVAPKSVVRKSGSKDVAETESSISNESQAVAPPPGYEKQSRTDDVSEEPPTKKFKPEKVETEHGVSVAHDSSKDNRTVFVSNLDYSVDEATLREVFSSVGTLTDLRLVKDFKGRSKGYCYVEFSSHSEAEAALKKDRECIDGRPMFISRCDSDRDTRQPGFKYNTTLEKNKLFVRGLPFTVTKEELEGMFKSYGSLKDVRIVTFRNGHSKGLAYVEFHDVAAAVHALEKTDGMTMGDRTISVAISKPPERKLKSSATAQSLSVKSLGGGPKIVGSRGRGRTQMSLLPRSLQISQNAAATTPSSTTVPFSSTVSSNSNSATNGDADGDTRKQMSNSDFRQMLLGTKK